MILKLANKVVFDKKLGPLETSRFLSITGKKRTESVKRHRQWQKNLNKEKFFNSVFGK